MDGVGLLFFKVPGAVWFLRRSVADDENFPCRITNTMKNKVTTTEL